jgi:hypothetical protein
MSSCRWKLKLDRYLDFGTRGPEVRAFCFHSATTRRVALAASLWETRTGAYRRVPSAAQRGTGSVI